MGKPRRKSESRAGVLTDLIEALPLAYAGQLPTLHTALERAGYYGRHTHTLSTLAESLGMPLVMLKSMAASIPEFGRQLVGLPDSLPIEDAKLHELLTAARAGDWPEAHEEITRAGYRTEPATVVETQEEAAAAFGVCVRTIQRWGLPATIRDGRRVYDLRYRLWQAFFECMSAAGMGVPR